MCPPARGDTAIAPGWNKRKLGCSYTMGPDRQTRPALHGLRMGVPTMNDRSQTPAVGDYFNRIILQGSTVALKRPRMVGLA